MRKVLVVHPSAQIFNIPCVVNSVESMCGENIQVTFASLKSTLLANGEDGFSDLVRETVYPFRQTGRSESFLHWALGYFIFLMWILCRERQNVLYAIGAKGLFLSVFLKFIFRCKIIFYSLEFPPTGGGYFARLYRFIERFACKYVDCLVVHDSNRLDLYSEIVRRQFDNVVMYPNAPIERYFGENECNELIERFHLNADKRYLLYAGGLYSGVGLDKLLDCLDQLPLNWCIFFQSHDGVNQLNMSDTARSFIEQGRLVVSFEPLSVRDYNALLSVAHAGLAIYDNNDVNMANVGLSSGKIAAYLKNGMPTIVNNIPYYSTEFSNGSAGVIIQTLKDVPRALAEIDSDYDVRSQQAIDFYNDKFDLIAPRQHLKRAVEELVK